MAIQAQHLAASDTVADHRSAAAEAGDEAAARLTAAGGAAERAGELIARDFYRAAASLTARANAEIVKAGAQ